MPLKNTKFRIFVDGSYDSEYKIGTIAYNMQTVVNFEGRVINVAVHNNIFAHKLTGCKHSFDAEISAIGLGFDTFRKIIGTYPILKKIPVRIKSDCMFAITYITKGKLKEGIEIDKDCMDDLIYLRGMYLFLKDKYPNFKLSYIPSKNNLAHNNAYEMLKWERSVK